MLIRSFEDFCARVLRTRCEVEDLGAEEQRNPHFLTSLELKGDRSLEVELAENWGPTKGPQDLEPYCQVYTLGFLPGLMDPECEPLRGLV